MCGGFYTSQATVLNTCRPKFVRVYAKLNISGRILIAEGHIFLLKGGDKKKKCSLSVKLYIQRREC